MKLEMTHLGSAFRVVTALLLIPHQSMAKNNDHIYSQVGEVTANSAVLWGRCNQEQKSQLKFTLTTHKNTSKEASHKDNHARIREQIVTDASDYTGSIVFKGLKPDTRYYYQAKCNSFEKNKDPFEGIVSSFKTASHKKESESVSFVWVADLAGQGWGRNPNLEITHVDGDLIKGGYVIFESMSKLKPDFALFQGDMIYADNPIPSQKAIPAEVGGGTWINDPAKDFVAINLNDFRENWKYNLGDKKLRDFLAKTPIYVQWDDHEVTNNWYPGEIMPEGAPYFGMAADTLAKNAKQALNEYNPIKSATLYRSIQHGKHMELFLLDERSYRGANPDNSDPNGIEMLGNEQLVWLKKR